MPIVGGWLIDAVGLLIGFDITMGGCICVFLGCALAARRAAGRGADAPLAALSEPAPTAAIA